MYVENELTEIVTTDDHKSKEIIEEYEEEILMQEEVLEPLLTNSADTTSAQGKPRCVTLIFYNHLIYICDVHLRYRILLETTCIDTPVLSVLLV